MIDMVSSNNTFANNSMIFKTIDSSVDNTRKTLALFNKDWNTYKTNWQQGFSQNGVAGGIKSIFQSSNSNSVISKDQLQILRNWNNAVAHGCTNQETFNRIIKDADSNTKLYFSGLNKGKGSVEGLKNAQNVAKQSTIGLTLAQTALNAAISLGFTAALMLAVKGLDKLINSAKRASEAADEAFSDTTEKVQKNEEEAKSLDELISKYKELKESENLDVDGRKEIKEIQNDIADLVGVQASNLDLVNGKLDDEIAKLDEISAKEAKNAYETATANYNNSKKATDKAAGDDSFLFVDGYSYTGKREKEAEKVLKNAGFGGNVQSGGFFGNTLFVMDSFDNDMKELKGAQEKADYLQSMIDVLEQNGQRATDLYAGLISQRDKYLQYIDNQQDAANSLVNSWISYSQFSNDELSKINVDSLDSFEEYRQKMIEEAKNDESIGKMLADGTLSDEDLENAVNDFMATSTKFSTWYEQWIGNIESDVQHETPISSFEDAWTSLKSSTDDDLKGQADDLLKLAEAGQLTGNALEELAGGKELMNNTGLSADELAKKINNLVDASTQLNAMSGQISKMSDMLADKKNGKTADASDLAGFDASVRGLESWDQFEKVMGDSKSSMKDCQEAANALATEWVNSGNYLENLTEDNKQYYITQLQAMGVENAEAVVTASLAQQKYELALEQDYVNLMKANGITASIDLANVTATEIQQLLNEGKVSTDTASKLAELVIKKRLASGTTLSTAADIKNLADLAGASTKLGKLLNNLARIKQGFTNGMPSDVAEKKAESLQKEIEALVGGGNSVNIDTGVNIKDTGSSNYKAPGTTKTKKNNKTKQEKNATEFNLIETYINKISRSIDNLDAKVSNTWLSWSKRNKALTSELKKVNSLENVQNQAADYYEKKASKVKLDDKTKKQLRNGEINIKTVKDEKLASKMQKYQEYWENYTKYTDDAKDSAQKYFDLLGEQFEFIQNKYDNKISLNESKKTQVQDRIDLTEARGQLIGTAYYKRQKQLNNQMIKQRKQEEKDLKEQIKGVKKYSEEWYNMKSKIAEVHSEYMQLKKDNAELQNSINQLKWDRFDELINKIDDIVSETDFLKSMLSDNLFDDNGKLTTDGLTAIGLTAQNYDVYLAEAQEYKDMIAEVEKMHRKGVIGYDEYITKMREYSKGQREALQSAKDAKDATIDYVKQGLDAQNEALSKQIDLKKKLLQEEKELKEWNEKIADQNKSIERMQRRLDIISQDDSQENQKAIRELKSKLEDARKEQTDSFYDKSITDQENSLDQMLENSKKQAEDYLKDSEKVFADATAYINANSKQVASNLEKMSKDLGYDISEYIANAWKDGSGAIVGYQNTLTENVGGIVGQINLIKTAWDEVCASADRAAQSIVNMQNGTTVRQLNQVKKNLQNTSNITPALGMGVKGNVIGGAFSAASIAASLLKDKIKKSSYASGGVVGDLVKLSGEDGMAFLKRGEAVLTKEQVQALVDFRPVLPQLNTMIDNLKNVPVNRNYSNLVEPRIEINTTVEGIATDQIVKDFENVATRQAENVVKRINNVTYAKGVRRR